MYSRRGALGPKARRRWQEVTPAPTDRLRPQPRRPRRAPKSRCRRSNGPYHTHSSPRTHRYSSLRFLSRQFRRGRRHCPSWPREGDAGRMATTVRAGSSQSLQPELCRDTTSTVHAHKLGYAGFRANQARLTVTPVLPPPDRRRTDRGPSRCRFARGRSSGESRGCRRRPGCPDCGP